MIKCEVNGKEYPVVFTMGALLRFKRMTGKDVSKMEGTMDDIMTLVYCAVIAGANQAGTPLEVTLEQFYDSMPMEQFAELSQAVVAQFTTEPEGGKKKKVRK